MVTALTEEKPRIAVIGSVNVDLVVTVRQTPKPGETVLGDKLRTVAGGKGANQAVAAARLGGDVALVGRIGTDEFGVFSRERLAADNVDCTYLLPTSEHRTGVALITVARDGQNIITVAPGANARLTTSDVRKAEPVIAGARLCIVQLEIPLDTAYFALELARRHGVETILDPAPAPTDPNVRLPPVDILTPNETEATQLVDRQIPKALTKEITAALLRRGAANVVLKLGPDGACVMNERHTEIVPGFEVKVVDTTAAGDAFTAALAVGRGLGMPLTEAARFANAAGALTCTKRGAQPSLPTFAEVRALLGKPG